MINTNFIFRMHFIIICLVFFNSFPVLSDCPNEIYKKQFTKLSSGVNGYFVPGSNQMEVDGSGNMYFIAQGQGSWETLDIEIPAGENWENYYNRYLFKFDNEFNYLWHVNLSESRHDFTFEEDAAAITLTDEKEVVMLARYQSDTVTLDQDTLNLDSREGVLAVHVSPEGEVLRHNNIITTDGENKINHKRGIRLSASSNNGYRVGLNKSGAIQAGNLETNTDTGTFVGSFNHNGDLQWHHDIPNTILLAMESANQENLLASFFYTQDIEIDGEVFPGENDQYRNSVLANFDADGNLSWSFTGTGAEILTSLSLAITESYIYATGNFEGATHDFGNDILIDNDSDMSQHYVIKLSIPNGEPQDIFTFEAEEHFRVQDMTVTHEQNLLITSSFRGNVHIDDDVFKNPAPAGTPLFTELSPETEHIHSQVVISEGNSNIYALNTHNQNLYFTGFFTEESIELFGRELLSVPNSQTNIFFKTCYDNITSLMPEPEDKESTLVAYPNPAQNHINIVAPEVMKNTELYTMDGRRLMHRKANDDELRLQLENIPEGFYLLRIETQNGNIFNERIIIGDKR